jgi:Fic family protein
MEGSLSQDVVVSQLWSAYKKTKEYQSGLKGGIPSGHSLVVAQEKRGLQSIYAQFILELKKTQSSSVTLKNRNVGDWLNEWKKMHKLLFKDVLKDCGNWREKEVRFGGPEDVELYKIPLPNMVPSEISTLAFSIREKLAKAYSTKEEKCKVLAEVHYQFIRIHPFLDGNGRIARALTDQLSIHFDLPPAMNGYPRHDKNRRDNYHAAIRAGATDPCRTALANWIQNYIDSQLEKLA